MCVHVSIAIYQQMMLLIATYSRNFGGTKFCCFHDLAILKHKKLKLGVRYHMWQNIWGAKYWRMHLFAVVNWHITSEDHVVLAMLTPALKCDGYIWKCFVYMQAMGCLSLMVNSLQKRGWKPSGSHPFIVAHSQSVFLNQARASRRPARAWFFEIDPVWTFVCVFACVCVRPKGY